MTDYTEIYDDAEEELALFLLLGFGGNPDDDRRDFNSNDWNTDDWG